MSRIALVAGATGVVGNQLLNKLLTSPDYAEVRILARRPLSQTHAKLSVLQTDFTDLARLGDALKADDVFCCLGTTLRKAGSKAAFEQVDYHYVVSLARAARATGSKQFLVISSVGAGLKATSFYLQVKGRMERDVIAAGYPSTHFLRPSLLMGPREESRPGERLAQIVMPLFSPLLLGTMRKYRPIEASAVADSMLTLALRNESGAHVHHLPLGNL